jgi:hypothetical protein
MSADILKRVRAGGHDLASNGMTVAASALLQPRMESRRICVTFDGLAPFVNSKECIIFFAEITA